MPSTFLICFPNDLEVIHNTAIPVLDRLAAIRKDIRQEGVEAIPVEGDKRRSKKKGNVICAEQRIILSETVPKTPTKSN